MGKKNRASPTRYRRMMLWFRRRFNGARRVGRAVRRFFTLEARPEDAKLRREVERLLSGKYGLQFIPWRQIEKTLREALRE